MARRSKGVNIFVRKVESAKAILRENPNLNLRRLKSVLLKTGYTVFEADTIILRIKIDRAVLLEQNRQQKRKDILLRVISANSHLERRKLVEFLLSKGFSLQEISQTLKEYPENATIQKAKPQEVKSQTPKLSIPEEPPPYLTLPVNYDLLDCIRQNTDLPFGKLKIEVKRKAGLVSDSNLRYYMKAIKYLKEEGFWSEYVIQDNLEYQKRVNDLKNSLCSMIVVRMFTLISGHFEEKSLKLNKKGISKRAIYNSLTKSWRNMAISWSDFHSAIELLVKTGLLIYSKVSTDIVYVNP